MRIIKKFESFVNDTNRDSSSIDYLPKHNPVIIQRAKEYIEDLSNKKYDMVFKLAGMEIPKNVDSIDLDKSFDEAKEKAIKFLIENPEAIGNEDFQINNVPKKSGDGIPRVQNIGGTSQTNSIIKGQ